MCHHDAGRRNIVPDRQCHEMNCARLQAFMVDIDGPVSRSVLSMKHVATCVPHHPGSDLLGECNHRCTVGFCVPETGQMTRGPGSCGGQNNFSCARKPVTDRSGKTCCVLNIVYSEEEITIVSVPTPARTAP